MDVIIDTNIFASDFMMNSHRFQILFDYLHRTQSRIIMTRLVLDELEAKYERELKTRLRTFSSATGNLRALLVDSPFQVPHIVIESEVLTYLKYLKHKIGIADEQIIDYRESHLRDVMTRAIRRIRPCSDDGEEIRDAVLWNTVLDIATATHDKKAIFISNNTHQFAGKDNALLPELVSETQKRGVTIHYHSSLDEFAKQHATIIDFITTDWLNDQLDFDEIYEHAWEDAAIMAKQRLPKLLDNNEFATGGINSSHGGFDLDEYFVYEMADGALQVEGVLFGHIEFEFEIEELTDDYDWDFELQSGTKKFGHRPKYGWRADARRKEKNVRLDLRAIINIIINNRKIVDWKITEVDER